MPVIIDTNFPVVQSPVSRARNDTTRVANEERGKLLSRNYENAFCRIILIYRRVTFARTCAPRLRPHVAARVRVRARARLLTNIISSVFWIFYIPDQILHRARLKTPSLLFTVKPCVPPCIYY